MANIKKVVKARQMQKHDLEINWLKAENFVPLPGEIIIYDAETIPPTEEQAALLGRNHAIDYVRIKIGNEAGDSITELPFEHFGGSDSGVLKPGKGLDSVVLVVSDAEEKPTAAPTAYGETAISLGRYCVVGSEESLNIDESLPQEEKERLEKIGKNSIAVNYKNTVLGERAFAANEDNKVTETAKRSAAFGWKNTVESKNSFGCGYNNTLSGDNSFGTGYSNKVKAINGFAAGFSNTLETTAENGAVFGEFNNISGQGAFASGSGHTVDGVYAAAFGYDNTVNGEKAFAANEGNTVTGKRSAAFGWQNGIGQSITTGETVIGGENSFAVGEKNTVGGKASFAAGSYNVIVAQNSIVSGFNNTIDNGKTDIEKMPLGVAVFGSQNQLKSNNTIVSGSHNVVDSYSSVVSGSSNTVSGGNNVVFGTSHSVSGDLHILGGETNILSGSNNLVSGKANTVAGLFATVMGRNNTVNNSEPNKQIENATVFGIYNEVTAGGGCLVNGIRNTMTGVYASAFGANNEVSGNCAFAAGEGLQTNDDTKVAFGKFNNSKTGALFMIGNGTSDTDRKNAFAVTNNSIIIGNTEITEAQLRQLLALLG